MTTRLKYLLLAILVSCAIWSGIIGGVFWFMSGHGDGMVTTGSK